MNYSSLIVDSNNQRVIGGGNDLSILSQERAQGSKKSRGAATNAMSELRKSQKAPLNSKKSAQDQLFGSILR